MLRTLPRHLDTPLSQIVVFGDYLNGNIYKLDGTIGTFDGARVHRQRTTIPASDEENRRRLIASH